MTSRRVTSVAVLTVGAAAVAGIALATVSGARTTAGAGATARAASCSLTGYGTRAAAATVQCYLTSLQVGDTSAACAMLSAAVREQIVHGAARTPGGTSGLMQVPSIVGPHPHPGPPDCTTAAPVMSDALDGLAPAARTRLRAALDAARIGTPRATGREMLVAVTMLVSGRRATDQVRLVRVDRRWKIACATAFALDR